ncbi:MAG: hypothetical protein GX907_01015 [Clostridiaceae bacterium]|nr:hypothetical protein [Clostridiaceae bacterium]
MLDDSRRKRSGRADQRSDFDIDLTKKVPPNNSRAEQSVLGGIMSGERYFSRIFGLLTRDDFYEPAHRLIYDAALSLAMSGKQVDVITVSDYLTSHGNLERAGDLAYIVSLPDQVPVLGNIEEYAEVVRQKSMLRKLLAVTQEMSYRCYEDAQDANALIDYAAGQLYSIKDARDGGSMEQYRAIIDRLILDLKKGDKGKKKTGTHRLCIP